MSEEPTRKPSGTADNLRDEYRFDYSMAKPNRFASQVGRAHLVVTLDEDVSEVFTSPEQVNHALRSLLAAMPSTMRDQP
jgi:hypothetical protein